MIEVRPLGEAVVARLGELQSLSAGRAVAAGCTCLRQVTTATSRALKLYQRFG